MTNMEGVGLLFLSFLIGVPFIAAVIIATFIVHKREVKLAESPLVPPAYDNFLRGCVDPCIRSPSLLSENS
jgi:hypothetical protein